MQKEVVNYVRKKIWSEFDSCQWEDGIREKFADTIVPRMDLVLKKMEYQLEDALEFQKKVEALLHLAEEVEEGET